ncbi:MAG: ABC transporter ATP-binding protein [Bacteroidales bacterium]
MQQMPVINIENLTKYFGEVTGVQNISLEVYYGEIFGFLGPNGAGKTTTIRMVLDLLRPSSGKIEIFGKDIKENAFKIRQKCGYLPGSFSAFGNLSGNEFLKLCAKLRNLKGKISQDLLNRFELSNSNLNQKIKFLSHGTLQKLGIVQAFFHNPELLILDEPTIGLDPLMQETFYELLTERKNKGCTIFLSSHNLAEVEKVCHRMAIIRKGEIVIVESIDVLQEQLSRKLVIKLEKPVGEFSLPNSKLHKQQGLSYEFLIQGDFKPMLKMTLSELPLANVVFS